MLFHIDAGNRCFAHAYAGTAIAGDEATDKLEQVGIVSDDQHILTVCVLAQKGLEVGIGGAEVQRRADFDFAFVAEFVPNKLRRLECAFQRTGHDHIRLDFKGTENSSHDHALFLTFRDQAAFGVEFCALALNTGIGMPHEVEVHDWGWAYPAGLSHFL